MPFYFTPTTIAFIIVALLLVFASVPAARSIRHALFLRKRFALLELPSSQIKNALDDLLKTETAFALETAAHHLGKEVHYYVAAPNVFINSVKDKWNAVEVDGYDIYHSGGSHLCFYLKSASPNFNMESVDFSKINEIGEGAIIQLVMIKRGGKRLANLRVLVSAPSPYQAQEIALGINFSLKEFKPTAVTRNVSEFIHQATFREFNEEEAMAWSS